MPLNLKDTNHIDPDDLKALLRDWGPTLNRWALKVENRLDAANQRTIQAPQVAKTIATQVASGLSGGTTDGLIHGDAIWAIDDATVILRDDFLTPEIVASVVRSQLVWQLTVPASAPSFVTQAFPLAGYLTFANNNTANNSYFLLPGPMLTNTGGNAPTAWPLFDYPSWKLVWNFRVGRPLFNSGANPPVGFNFGQTSFYLGLGNWSSQTGPFVTTVPARPSTFFGLRYDTDTTAPAISDTQFVFEAVQNPTAATTRNNAQGTTFATGITPTEGVDYRLEILCTTAGAAKLTLYNGTTSATTTLTMPTYLCSGTSAITLMSQTGIGIANANLAAQLIPPFAGGSKFTLGSIGNPSYSSFAGNWVSIGTPASAHLNFFKSGTIANAVMDGSLTGQAALYPYFAFGNDTQATPTANSKAILLDYFGFAWNPGVGGGTGTATTNKVRYW